MLTYLLYYIQAMLETDYQEAYWNQTLQNDLWTKTLETLIQTTH